MDIIHYYKSLLRPLKLHYKKLHDDIKKISHESLEQRSKKNSKTRKWLATYIQVFWNPAWPGGATRG
jgi:hypothetical protein